MRFASVLTSALLALAGVGSILAHEGHGHSKAIDFRNSVMTIFKWNMDPMGAMVKGEMPYDQNAFAAYAKDLAAAAHLDLLAGFPEGSEEGDTGALPDIWLNWEGFVKRYETLKTETAKLSEIAQDGDMDAAKAQFQTVGKSCKGCHQEFKD
jgi:cytochrome c556